MGKDISQTECWCSHHSRDRGEDRRARRRANGRGRIRWNQEGKKPFTGEERTEIKMGGKERKKSKEGPLFAFVVCPVDG